MDPTNGICDARMRRAVRPGPVETTVLPKANWQSLSCLFEEGEAQVNPGFAAILFIKQQTRGKRKRETQREGERERVRSLPNRLAHLYAC